MKKNILGVNITDATEKEILEYIGKIVQKRTEKCYVVTPNPEIVVYATKHPEFKTVLNEAGIALCDGIGVLLAGKILNKPFKARVTGTDVLQSICKEVAEKPVTVGFLGGRDKIAEKTAKCLQKKHPSLKILLATSGNPDQKTVKMVKNAVIGKESNSKEIRTNDIDRSLNMQKSDQNSDNSSLQAQQHIDILFVAFGFPKQEFWMHDNLSDLPVTVAIGVGGAFDYISENVPRAPKFFQQIGFEWLFRLCVQPWRIVRQLALIEFAWLVFKEKLKTTGK